jgi:hypothetical protein
MLVDLRVLPYPWSAFELFKPLLSGSSKCAWSLTRAWVVPSMFGAHVLPCLFPSSLGASASNQCYTGQYPSIAFLLPNFIRRTYPRRGLVMAPRKEKTEKVSANEAADTILNYLREWLHYWKLVATCWWQDARQAKVSSDGSINYSTIFWRLSVPVVHTR